MSITLNKNNITDGYFTIETDFRTAGDLKVATPKGVYKVVALPWTKSNHKELAEFLAMQHVIGFGESKTNEPEDVVRYDEFINKLIVTFNINVDYYLSCSPKGDVINFFHVFSQSGYKEESKGVNVEYHRLQVSYSPAFLTAGIKYRTIQVECLLQDNVGVNKNERIAKSTTIITLAEEEVPKTIDGLIPMVEEYFSVTFGPKG